MIGMELYGQAHPVVYGDSIIRGGSISGLSGTVRPDALCRLDLIQRGYFGLSGGAEHQATGPLPKPTDSTTGSHHLEKKRKTQ
jgi:hypothetical protein